MPIYEYQCQKCGEMYELLRRIDEFDNPAHCEATVDCEGLGERVMSIFRTRKILSKQDQEIAKFDWKDGKIVQNKKVVDEIKRQLKE